MSIAPVGRGLALEEPMGDVWRGLLFGQAIDEVVHDEVDDVDVLARAGLRWFTAANGETVLRRPPNKDGGDRAGPS